MSLYRIRIEGRSQIGAAADRVRLNDEIERSMRLAGIRAERDKIYSLARDRSIDDDVARKLVRELDLVEARIKGSDPQSQRKFSEHHPPQPQFWRPCLIGARRRVWKSIWPLASMSRSGRFS